MMTTSSKQRSVFDASIRVLLNVLLLCSVQVVAWGQGGGQAQGVGPGFAPIPEELIGRFASAGDEGERQRLLDENKDALTDDLADSILWRASTLSREGKLSESLPLYDFARAVSARVGYKRGEGRALKGVAEHHFQRGDYRKAAELAGRVKTLAEESGDTWALAASFEMLGLVAHAGGVYPEALRNYEEALRLLKDGGSRESIAYILNNMGDAYRLTKDYDKALKLFEQSLTIVEEVGNRNKAAGVLNNIGIVHKKKGRVQEALDAYRRSLAISTEVSNKREMGGTLTNIGIILAERGKHEEALEHFRRSLTLLEEVGFKSGVADALRCIGALYHEQGKKEQAAEHYRRSQKLNEEMGDLNEVRLLQTYIDSLKR
jgi:tetratricopeptide (TPR) repeat protein